jgi:hypothetical protein
VFEYNGTGNPVAVHGSDQDLAAGATRAAGGGALPGRTPGTRQARENQTDLTA